LTRGAAATTQRADRPEDRANKEGSVVSYSPEVTFFAELNQRRRPPTDPLAEGWELLRAYAVRSCSGRALRRRLIRLDRWAGTPAASQDQFASFLRLG
jgi:hypothetical protein